MPRRFRLDRKHIIVLELVLKGKKTREIASKLGYAHSTNAYVRCRTLQRKEYVEQESGRRWTKRTLTWRGLNILEAHSMGYFEGQIEGYRRGYAVGTAETIPKQIHIVEQQAVKDRHKLGVDIGLYQFALAFRLLKNPEDPRNDIEIKRLHDLTHQYLQTSGEVKE